MSFFFRPRNEGKPLTTSAEIEAFLRGGSGIYAGTSVTPQTALSVAAVFACVRAISEDIAKLPFVVYRTAAGSHERARTSPYWRLIHDRPNPFQTSQQFREYLTASALLYGNGYALKNVLGGQVVELLPLHPNRVTPSLTEDWEPVYDVRLKSTGPPQRMTRAEIFHLPGLSFLDPFSGISIVQYARQAIGTQMARDRQQGVFYGNGMKPSVAFSHPGKLSLDAQKRLKAGLHEEHGGENAGGTIVLEEGMKIEKLSVSAEDSQLVEMSQFGVLEFCRFFRIPPHKIAELTRATFSNISHQSLEYVQDTLMSWGERWNAAVNQQVIVTSSVQAEILFDALLKGTTLERYQAHRIAAGGPWLAPNEVRALENRPPMAGLDEVRVPLNTGASGSDQGEPREPAVA